MRRLLVLTALLSAGCGSSSTAPTPVVPTPTPTPAPTLATITGHVTATNGGQPLSGLTATLGTHTATTDGSGTFSAQTTPTSAITLLLTGSGIVPRSLLVATITSRDVSVNAITLGGSFDLNFYRQLVRNTIDAPSGLEPLRRWTRTPQIYVKTVDEAGEVINAAVLDQIEAIVRDAVPRWTSGALGTPTITRGTDSREGISGWITIKFPAVNTAVSEGVCGRAQVAVDGGWIELGYHVPPTVAGTCRVPGYVIAPGTIRHEIGHALGFWHTGTPGDLMYTLGSWLDLSGLPTPRELAHAAIAYARPVGNLDPDIDPFSAVNLAPMSVR